MFIQIEKPEWYPQLSINIRIQNKELMVSNKLDVGLFKSTLFTRFATSFD